MVTLVEVVDGEVGVVVGVVEEAGVEEEEDAATSMEHSE